MSTGVTFMSTTKGKIAFCVGGLLFSLVVLLLSMDFSISSLIPNESVLDNLRREQKKAVAAWAVQEAREKEFNAMEKHYRTLIESAWLESRDGSPDVELPKRLNAAASKLELELQNVTAVRRTRLNDQLFLLEMDVNTYATMDLLTAFWNELRSMTPPFSWKRIDIRPEIVQNSDQVYFSGTLRVIGRTEESVTTPTPRKETAK